MIGLVIFGASTPAQRGVGKALYPCRHCGDQGPHEVTHFYRVASLMFIPFTSNGHRWVAICQRCRQPVQLPQAPNNTSPLPFMQRSGWIVLFPTLALLLVGGVLSPLVYNMIQKPKREAAYRAHRAEEEAAAAKREQERAAAAALEQQVKDVLAIRDKIGKEDDACTEHLLTQVPKTPELLKLAEKKPKSVEALKNVPFTVTQAGLYTRDTPLLGTKQLCFTRIPDKLAHLRWASDLEREGPLEERRTEATTLLAQAKNHDLPPVHAFLSGACDTKKKKCSAAALFQRTTPAHETLAVAHVSIPLPEGGEKVAMKQLGAALSAKLAAWK